MLKRLAVASLVALATATGNVSAQTYSRPTAAPRTTDAGALAAAARARAVHERFMRGVAAEERGDWSGAETEFQRVVALDPPEPQGSSARYDLALAETHLAKDDAAVTLLQEALHRDPRFAAAAANLVIVELRRGDLPAARRAADQYLALAPDSVMARYARGLAALKGGDLATARDDFRALIGADPAYAAAHYDLALVELRGGRDDAARLELDRALELSPNYARARFALGTVLMRGAGAPTRASRSTAAHATRRIRRCARSRSICAIACS